VKSLSGGERHRLLLARLLTRPANVLILDEPTNDLDLETLELIEAELAAFPGTVLLVSHDRAFLDNVVTSVFAFEGDGRIVEYVGGYEDWERQRVAQVEGAAAAAAPKPTKADTRARPTSTKLSYKEKRELEALPGTIDALETEIREIEARLGAPEFYREPADLVRTTVERLEAARAELETAYRRWHDLDERQ